MTTAQTILIKAVEYFFHLPTLITLAVIGLICLWVLYGIDLDFGNEFIRLNSNRATIELFWDNGCCDLRW